jgi:hypothetical protein
MGTSTPVLQLFKPLGTEFVDVVASINNNWDRLETQLKRLALSQEDPWHTVGGAGEPPFTNGWGVPTQGVFTGISFQFRKDIAGNVHMRGALGTGTASTSAFTLPVGYRPTHNQVVLIGGHAGGSGPVSQWNILPDGTVSAFVINGTTPGNFGIYAPPPFSVTL